jgi:hypothetical protein
VTQTDVKEEQQTRFEEEQLEDPALLTALNEWATADAGLDTAKENGATYRKAVDDAREGRDEARAVISARLKQMEIEIVGTENVYRCGTYRIGSRHTDAKPVSFDRKAKDTLTIERAE